MLTTLLVTLHLISYSLHCELIYNSSQGTSTILVVCNLNSFRIKIFNKIAVAAEYAHYYKFIVLNIIPSNCNCCHWCNCMCMIQHNTVFGGRSSFWCFIVVGSVH